MRARWLWYFAKRATVIRRRHKIAIVACQKSCATGRRLAIPSARQSLPSNRPLHTVLCDQRECLQYVSQLFVVGLVMCPSRRQKQMRRSVPTTWTMIFTADPCLVLFEVLVIFVFFCNRLMLALSLFIPYNVLGVLSFIVNSVSL